jgi:hypothetical protein
MMLGKLLAAPVPIFEMVELNVTGVPTVAVVGVRVPAVRSGGAAVTVTVAGFVAVPPAPVHVSV